MSEQAAKPRRRIWLRIVLVLVAIWLLFTSPFLWWSFRFRQSAMVGLTPQQVLERFGEPDYVNSADYEERTGGADSTHWGRLDDATRRDLIASKDMLFGYYGWMGDQFTVCFENGVVKRVRRSSK